MSAPKRYPAPLGDTPHPLISGGDGYKRKDLSVDKGEMKREKSHHLDQTKGGHTLGRRGGLLVSGLLRESGVCVVKTRVSTGRCRGRVE